jgi:ferritin
MKRNIRGFEEFVKESVEPKAEEVLNEAIVDEERLGKKVIEILNKQIKNELNSSQMYRAMSCWLDDQKWPASVKVFFKYADEELTHMTKIYQYLFDRNCKVTVPTSDEQKAEFKDIKEMVETALEHEMEVTKNWEDISKLAKDEDDSTTFEFAQWFLKEQIEEEDKMRTIIEKIDLDMPKYEIDCYIGTL